MIKLVIFDLDGTLLNTIADLGNSTNYALERLGYPIHGWLFMDEGLSLKTCFSSLIFSFGIRLLELYFFVVYLFFAISKKLIVVKFKLNDRFVIANITIVFYICKPCCSFNINELIHDFIIG